MSNTPIEKLSSDPPDGGVEAFGYRPQLRRSMGFFSTFAISFSLLSITTGLFANYGFGLSQAGPRFIWTWLIVGVGNLIIAFCLAHLASRVPLAGYAYQWASRMISVRYGWFPGWLALVGWLTGTAGVAYAFAAYFAPYVGIGSSQGTIIAITALVLLSWAIIHILGIKLASGINNFSVAAEFIGTMLVGVGLLIYALVKHMNNASILSHANPGGAGAGISALAVSSLMAAYCLTGFEGAADLAEESTHPVRNVPRAITRSYLWTMIAGFVALLGFTLAIPNLKGTEASSIPLFYITRHYLNGPVTAIFMTAVFIAIYACGLINMAAVSRLMFSMARDNTLPGSTVMSRVSRNFESPYVAIIISTIISVLFTLVAKAEAIITSVSSVAVYTSYALIILAGVYNKKIPEREGAWSLGSAFKPLAWISVLWVIAIDCALVLPKINRHALEGFGVTLALAIIWYFIRIRSVADKLDPLYAATPATGTRDIPSNNAQ
jgi:amino acid transporter